jgi:hypothetical protein
MCADCVRLAEKYEHRVHLEPRINGQHAVPVDVPPSAAQLRCRVCCPRTEAVRRAPTVELGSANGVQGTRSQKLGGRRSSGAIFRATR